VTRQGVSFKIKLTTFGISYRAYKQHDLVRQGYTQRPVVPVGRISQIA